MCRQRLSLEKFILNATTWSMTDMEHLGAYYLSQAIQSLFTAIGFYMLSILFNQKRVLPFKINM